MTFDWLRVVEDTSLATNRSFYIPSSAPKAAAPPHEIFEAADIPQSQLSGQASSAYGPDLPLVAKNGTSPEIYLIQKCLVLGTDGWCAIAIAAHSLVLSTREPWKCQLRRLRWLLLGLADFKNHVPSREASSVSLPFICILHTFYLRIFNWSSQACWPWCLCAYIILNPLIHAKRFVPSLYPRPPLPRNLLTGACEGGFNFVTLPFNNAISLQAMAGPHLDATRGFTPSAPTVLLK